MVMVRPIQNMYNVQVIHWDTMKDQIKKWLY
ncbi:hypothetical protein AB210_0281 [Acinetobacter baumannii AB210]|nr:hypothetical protein AB210_0281 [Acinetobacter baumannii AB210]